MLVTNYNNMFKIKSFQDSTLKLEIAIKSVTLYKETTQTTLYIDEAFTDDKWQGYLLYTKEKELVWNFISENAKVISL